MTMMGGVRRSPLVALLVLATAGVAACSASLGDTGTVSEGEVEDRVKEGLAAEVGTAPESVECDDDLPAEVGASIRCVLTAPNGDRVGLTVTTTEVDGDDVRFEFVVDDQVME